MFTDVEEGSKEETKYILRFLEQKDITKDLIDREVFLLWPDDGLWYPADVKKVCSWQHPPELQDPHVQCHSLSPAFNGAMGVSRPSWYKGQTGKRCIAQVELRYKQANVHYTTTDEKENINLDELVTERQIAFSTPPANISNATTSC